MQDADARAPLAPALDMYLTRLFLPLEDRVLTADVSPENCAWLAAHLGKPLEVVSRADLLAAIKCRHGAALLDQAVFGLARRFPELSARQVLTRPQAVVMGALAFGLLAALAVAALQTWQVFVALMTIAFCTSGIFRALLTLLARRTASHPLSGLALPSYTILVPLYREAEVLPALVRGLLALDYPRHLLDIKLVVEEDDHETVTAAQAQAALNNALEVIAVPPGGPRTKPKAANYALAFARGDYLVVYDAEDRPESDQLKKAVATFRASSRTTACLQARLTFFNAGHCWLTNGIMAQTPLDAATA